MPAFEQAVAARVGAPHAVAVNSATSALHVACHALGLGEGDLLWTVPNTFVASANCGRYCRADVDFVDIDPDTWNISIPALRRKLQQAEAKRRLPKIVVPVHFAGQPTDQEAIWELAQQYGFRVLEDASHAIGAERNGEAVGSCRWSDVTVFSFHPVKIITTGEGGMALTKDRRLADAMALLRSHGITRDASIMAEKNPGPWYYEQLELGYNYRMTDIQAALGASQLARLKTFVARRRELAARYDALLADLPVQLPKWDVRAHSSWHLYVVRLRLDKIDRSHRLVIEALRAAGIGANLHYLPVHLQPYYRALGFAEGHCPEAERYSAEAISLPLYPALSEANQDYIATTLRELLK